MAAPVSVPGLADHHAHLLRDAAGVAFPPTAAAVASFHRQVAGLGRSPMDMLDTGPGLDEPGLPGRLLAGLARAAAAGLVEITEMGMRSWAYLDALTELREPSARSRAGSGSTWPAAWPRRAAWPSLTRAGRPAGRGCGSTASSSTRTAGSCPAPALCARTSRMPAARASCLPVPQALPAGSRRWPGEAGGSPPMPSATGPCRPCSTPTSWPSTVTWPQSRPPRPGSSTPACCPPT